MKRYLRRAAFAALLAAPIPVCTASAASAVPAVPAARVSSCPLPFWGHPEAAPAWPAPAWPALPWPALPWRRSHVEALIGNLSPAAGSTVAPGSTVSFLIADEKPFPAPLSRDASITVNGAAVTPTAGAGESGVPVTYANPRDNGSRSTKYEVPFSFALPTNISGSAHVRATAYDGDGGTETVCWTLNVQTTALPSGALGGFGVAALGGLALMVVQFRRRRGATPAAS
jgi:hypothetical protein